MTRAHEQVCAVVAALQPGEVVSYGDVADVAGLPGRSRWVGRILADDGDDLPWWRVVTATGRLVPGLEDEHERLLAAEGVEVRSGRVRRSPTGRFSDGRSPARRPSSRC